VTGFGETAGSASRLVVVTLRTRFDETTISPRRGNSPLTPDSLAAALVDAAGRRFVAEPSGVTALRAPLRPGESYATDLAFRVPPDAEGLRLSLVGADEVTCLLVGHERAPLARETLLALR
jgi:hypothetical protein